MRTASQATTLQQRWLYCLLTGSLLSILLLAHQFAAAASPPASITISSNSNRITADGSAAFTATLKNADGSLYTGTAIRVSFSSPCAASNTAILTSAVTTSNGLASATYQPNGCTGTDTISASISNTAGSPASLSASAWIIISTNKLLSPKASLGKAVFFDKGMSAAGNLACASCHSAANAYMDSNPFPVPLGGTSGTVPGFRSSPSAAYAALVGSFALSAPDGSGGPHGGLMWDGRVNGVAAQAQGPFTGPHEMANPNNAAVLGKLLSRPYLASFRQLFGPVSTSSNPDIVVANLASAVAQYEIEDPSFNLLNSKYDAAQKNLASFNAQEANGMALFFNPAKAACAGCHSSTNQNQPQLFSNFSFHALAVPRNWTLPYNNDSSAGPALQALGLGSLLNGAGLGAPNHLYYDLGACGPFRTDLKNNPALCGAFRVPSLRNKALKSSYFHNGVYSSFGQVIHFYLNRDLQAQTIYLKANGSPDIAYNDLPVKYQGNRETRPPFAPVRGGARLSAAEIQDLIAFLCTLTDGYDPQNPAAYPLPQQCRAALRP